MMPRDATIETHLRVQNTPPGVKLLIGPIKLRKRLADLADQNVGVVFIFFKCVYYAVGLTVIARTSFKSQVTCALPRGK